MSVPGALLGLLLCGAARAAEPGWDLRLSTPSVVLGETVVLSGTLPPGAPERPGLATPSAEAPFAVVRAAVSGRAFEAELLPLATGAVALSLSFRGKGDAEAAASPPAVVSVTEPEPVPEALSPRDIKPPLPARPRLWPWLAAAAAGLLAWALWRRRERGPGAPGRGAPRPRDLRPPWEAALASLESLRGSGLWEKGRRREYYAELSDILRLYLEGRFGVPATRLTTGETLRGLRALELPRREAALARAVLERADLVKFSGVEAEEAWGGEDLEAVSRIVRETAPQPEPAPAGGAR